MTCQVSVYVATPYVRRDGWRTKPRPCGEPIDRYGLCAKHAAEHDRLCRDGCGRCGR